MPQHTLRTELLPADPDLVIPFMRQSYGANYKGDDSIRAHFERVDRVVGLSDELGGLAAAAMIEGASNDRIITVATSLDVARFGSRGELMIALLRSCREHGKARWISIGQQYDAMHRMAGQAGMSRLLELSAIERMLDGTDLDHHYELTQDEQGIAVITTTSGPNEGSTQQLWTWEEVDQ